MLVEVDVRMMRLCDRLLEAPDLFAPTLRTLHTAQDRRSAGFAITFVTNMISHPSELPDNLWELLVAHDLPPIVIDVATDPRTYTATDPDDMVCLSESYLCCVVVTPTLGLAALHSSHVGAAGPCFRTPASPYQTV